jgi:hypothetical protein
MLHVSMPCMIRVCVRVCVRMRTYVCVDVYIYK